MKVKTKVRCKMTEKQSADKRDRDIHKKKRMKIEGTEERLLKRIRRSERIVSYVIQVRNVHLEVRNVQG